MNFKKFLWKSRIKNNKGQVSLTPDDVKDPSGSQAGSQAGQATKLTGILSDIDLSDVPENIRGEVAKRLEEKVKRYDSGFQSKMADLSKERRELEEQRYKMRDLMRLQEEVSGNPDLEGEITNLINQARAGNLKKKDVNSSTDKMLDKLISSADNAETREQLQLLRNVVKEEVKDLVELKDQYKGILDKMKSLESVTHMTQMERADAKIKSLTDRFGKEVIEKYKDDLKKLAVQYPNMSTEKLFYFTATDEELSSALVAEQKRKLEQEEKRKLDGSFGTTSGIKRPIELVKDKHGRTNFRDLATKLFQKAGV